MKQTAVEWIVEMMTKEGYFGTFCTADELPVHKERVAQIVREAKKLEIEQLKDAWKYKNEHQDIDDEFDDYMKNHFIK
jgi:hypothetical protein